jgi:hypothetical protein
MLIRPFSSLDFDFVMLRVDLVLPIPSRILPGGMFWVLGTGGAVEPPFLAWGRGGKGGKGGLICGNFASCARYANINASVMRRTDKGTTDIQLSAISTYWQKQRSRMRWGCENNGNEFCQCGNGGRTSDPENSFSIEIAGTIKLCHIHAEDCGEECWWELELASESCWPCWLSHLEV